MLTAAPSHTVGIPIASCWHVKSGAQIANTNKAVLLNSLYSAAAKRRKVSAVDTPEQALERKKWQSEARALTHGLLLASGVNPNMTSKLYSPTSLIRRSVTELEGASIGLGAPSTVDRDRTTSVDLLATYLTKQLDGAFGSIVTDGATFKHEKVVVILFQTSALQRPVLLDLVVPDGHEVYDHASAATDIKAAMSQFKIDLSNVTCLTGDNVTFNDSLARELGVARARCIPHALNLLAKHGLQQLPAFKHLVQTAGTIIRAGATNKRAAELRAAPYELNPDAMIMYPNRFGSGLLVAKYRLENFATVKKWHLEGATLPKADDDDAIDDDFGDEEEEGLSKNALLLKRTVAARSAYSDAGAPITLKLADLLFGDVPALINDSGGLFSSVPANLPERLCTLRQSLGMVTTIEGAKVAVEEACTALLPMPTAAKRSTAVSKFGDSVRRAAEKSADSYDKHIGPALDVLKYRFRFDVRNGPPQPEEGVPAPIYPKEFYGCLPDNYGVAINVQYDQFTKEWWSKTAPDPAGSDPDHAKFYWATKSNYDFWKSKVVVWGKLAPVALYWTEVPTSSLAAERAFALGRIIDVPQRRSMSWKTFKEELALRIHREDVEELLKAVLPKM